MLVNAGAVFLLQAIDHLLLANAQQWVPMLWHELACVLLCCWQGQGQGHFGPQHLNGQLSSDASCRIKYMQAAGYECSQEVERAHEGSGNWRIPDRWVAVE